jgi:hypothetical protein
MKFRIRFLAFILSALSAGAWAQCSIATLKPVWDSDKSQFRCVDPKHPDVAVKDDSVEPTGDKDSCSSARDNLQAVCPTSNEGKACRSQAKSIYNACTRRGKSDSGSFAPGSTAGKTDSATCMTTFQQQQQACNARKLPPTAPGQPVVQDTCLQDALAAQSKCLTNSH